MTHKDVLLKCFHVHPFVLLHNLLQVHFRATHYDPSQCVMVGPYALRMERVLSEVQSNTVSTVKSKMIGTPHEG